MSAGTQWRIVLGVAVAVLVIGAAVYVNRTNTRIDGQATAAYREAQAAMQGTDTPATTETARDWLLANGWIIGTSPQGDWVSAFYKKDAGPFDPPEYLIIRGYRRLGADDNIPGDRWISLHFRFNPDKTFQSVYLDRNAPPPPGWRPTATTQ